MVFSLIQKVYLKIKVIIRMKNLFYLLSVILITFACLKQKPEKEEVKFINDAITRARVANKLLIFEFRAPECSSCMRLEQDIFENENYREFLIKNFVFVKVSAADSVL